MSDGTEQSPPAVDPATSRAVDLALPIRRYDHWAVVRCRRQGATLDTLAAGGSAPGPGALAGLARRATFHWTDQARTTMLLVQGADGPSWHLTDGDVAVVRGQVRWWGRSWEDPAAWARQLLARWPSRPYGNPLEGTSGDATVACIDRFGRGVVAADEFGAASVYYHLSSDLLVAASRPGLVGEVLQELGRAVEPDELGLAWLARAGYQVGARTSHRGISRLPMGARIALTGRNGVTVVEQANPWCDHTGFSALGIDEVLDVVHAAVSDHLVAALGLGRRLVIDLTGGKDSRLVLAVALSVLPRDSFLLRTIGPDTAPDVQISREIATRLGIEFQSGFPRPRTPGRFADHADTFLAATDGMQSLWVASVPHPFEAEVRVSGVSGEMLRVGMYEVPLVDAGPASWAATPTQAAEVVDVAYDRALAADIVLPEIRARLHQDLVAYFEHLAAIGTPADQLLYRYYAGYHNRVVTGELLDVEADHRVLPLVDVRGVRALGALPQTVRYGDPVHIGLIRRLAPELMDHRLASGRWRDAPLDTSLDTPLDVPRPTTDGPRQGPGRRPSSSVRRRLRALRPATSTPESVATPASADAPRSPDPARSDPARSASWPVLAVAKAGPDPERSEHLTQVLAEAPDQVWRLFDRDLVERHLADFDSVAMKSRKQVYAAATVARWLQRTASQAAPRTPGADAADPSA